MTGVPDLPGSLVPQSGPLILQEPRVAVVSELEAHLVQREPRVMSLKELDALTERGVRDELASVDAALDPGLAAPAGNFDRWARHHATCVKPFASPFSLSPGPGSQALSILQDGFTM